MLSEPVTNAAQKRVRGDASAARGLGQAFELVSRLVDRLEATLVLVALARGSEVRMPALGHPPAGELHHPLVERRSELEQQQRGVNIQKAGYSS